jgi:hypothetical protein
MALAGASASRIRADVHAQAQHAIAQLARGLGDFGVRDASASPPAGAGWSRLTCTRMRSNYPLSRSVKGWIACPVAFGPRRQLTTTVTPQPLVVQSGGGGANGRPSAAAIHPPLPERL